MNNSATKFCPVPLEQQPTYEYQQLRNSWFFSWVILPRIDYVKKILWVGFAMSWIVAPIAAVSFLPALFPSNLQLRQLSAFCFLLHWFCPSCILVGLMSKTACNNQEFLMRNRDGTTCLLYTSPSPRDLSTSRMPSSA